VDPQYTAYAVDAVADPAMIAIQQIAGEDLENRCNSCCVNPPFAVAIAQRPDARGGSAKLVVDPDISRASSRAIDVRLEGRGRPYSDAAPVAMRRCEPLGQVRGMLRGKVEPHADAFGREDLLDALGHVLVFAG